MRLEQRIGRVDRIGQTRPVHVFHLIAGDSDEVAMRDRLIARITVADNAIGSADPLTSRGERSPAAVAASRPVSTVAGEAVTEATRLQQMREITGGRDLACRWAGEEVLLARSSSRWRARLRDRALLLFVSTATARSGHPIAYHVTPALATIHRADVTLSVLDAITSAIIDPELMRWRRETVRAHQAFWHRQWLRLQAIRDDVATSRGPVQPGLFDLRVRQALDRRERTESEALAQIEVDIAGVERWREIDFGQMRPVLVLAP